MIPGKHITQDVVYVSAKKITHCVAKLQLFAYNISATTKVVVRYKNDLLCRLAVCPALSTPPVFGRLINTKPALDCPLQFGDL